MSKIYFTSDLHLGHDRDFIWGPRGFKSVYEMNDTIIKNWNSIVQLEDDVYILGDLMLNDNNVGIAAIKQLKGKIHVIRGNHDAPARMELYRNCYNIVEVTEGQFFQYNGYHFYLSHYPTICSNLDEKKPLKNRVINLCGHRHIKNKFADMDKGLIYHVELDAHDNNVVSIDTIIENIKDYIKEK